MPRPKGVISKLSPDYVKQNYVKPLSPEALREIGGGADWREPLPGEGKPPLQPDGRRDLAAEFKAPEPKYNPRNPYQDEQGRFTKAAPGGGRKKGGNNDTVKAIKAYMIELLDDDHYRRGLTRRIKAGELPQIELFLLTKALGKPKEELEITTNVPLFALPTTFMLKEDEVEPESVKLLEEGGENGADPVRK